MSVNITVNGKLSSHWRSHQLLDDPQKVKKAEEKERRKLRLLQVREESKKLAKKIRDEVSEEKRKELQKLQAIKQRELECWRQNALKRNGDEYSAAIFQVGSAHRAAKEENEALGVKQIQQRSYKDFKKQIAARKCLAPKDQMNCHSLCPCKLTLPDGNNKLKYPCTQTENHNTKTKCDVNKRKRSACSSSSESECEDDVSREQTKLPLSLSSTYESTSSSMFVPNKNKCLIKTPTVLLDVEVETDDSVTINAPTEVKDKYAEYNRQFDSVIRLSPRKGHKQKENACETLSVQQSLKTNTSSNDVTSKGPNTNKSCFVNSENNQPNNKQAYKEKRFTIISDLVKKQQQSEPIAVESNFVASCTPNAQAISTQLDRVHPSIPRPLVQPRQKNSATSKSSGTAATQHIPSLTTTSKINTAGVSGSVSSGRVQFYDYNSKLAKEQDQNTGVVNVHRQRDQNQPSAMEQAELENQRERQRQLEILKKCQIMEERGEKALEREQIRRDCNELTEKLDNLSREYPRQFPTNDNQLHTFADKQLRKEDKMNSAIEKLLQRPSVITCSEKSNYIKDGANKSPTDGVHRLNLASTNRKPLSVDDVSSDSCCSILLGYVDDQSRLIKRDLQKNDNTQSQSKQKQLKNLLERLEKLRSSLVEELRSEFKSKDVREQTFSSKMANHKNLVDNISEMCKERAEILFSEKAQDLPEMSEREKEIHAKENVLDTKRKEFYGQQNDSQKTALKKKDQIIHEQHVRSSSNKKKDLKVDSNNRGNMICGSRDNPLEIIITVRGENNSDRKSNKPKRKKILRRSPCKLSTLIRSPQPSISKTKKYTPNKKYQTKTKLHKQNSYDSNSTSYMSLPPELTTKIDDLAQRITEEKLPQSKKPIKEPETIDQIRQNEQHELKIAPNPVNEMSRFIPLPRVNPLIAQYVHRLLGMSRNAVHKLGVSSSDIETPGSSIINTTENVTDTIISDELTFLHNFIEENKSFIKEFEESIRLQNNVSLESSTQAFDDIWRKRLKRENKPIKLKKSKEYKERVPIDKLADNKTEQIPSLKIKEMKTLKNNIKQKPKNLPKYNEVDGKTIAVDSLLKDLSRSLSSHCSTDEKESTTSLTRCKPPIETFDKAIEAKISINSSKSEPDSQIARYAKLTQNCTHRIAELTELINRVREEKQRLLEVTLSSVSDNGRQSTEYLELPESKSNSRNEQLEITRASFSSEEATHNKQSRSSDTLHEMHTLSSADKNKQIGNSRDSGIAESRPITSLENRTDQEPTPQTSSESILPQAIRKLKPPPTLKHYSPQLPEDELAHELSTIFEVDTPATSRINTAAAQQAEERDNTLNSGLQEPINFPTFEQYTHQINLNHLQQEFTTFLECVEQNRSAEGGLHLNETVEECLAKLHISGIYPRHFPPLRDYIKRNKSNSLPCDEQQLLDTKSLENITEGQSTSNTDNDSASLDIEEELKKRQILKNSFRIENQQSIVQRHQKNLAAESGVDKLSTSDNTSDLLDSDLKRNIHLCSVELTKKTKEVKIFSSTTTSSDSSAIADSALRAASLDESSKGSGHVFNLRDFLTRELEKLANSSGSITNSSCDESLRSHFLHSLIGSLTPCTAGATSKSGAHTLDRQKTSTPVPMPSSQTHSTASNHSHSNSTTPLFSGESNLSSVYHQDRSVRLITRKGANADQSS